MLGAMEERLSRMTLGSLQNTRLGEVESSSHERVSTKRTMDLALVCVS